MTTPVPHASAASAEVVDAADLSAVLVLDATGNVVAGNRSALQLWAAQDRSLVGFAFGGLLAAAVPPTEPESPTARWQALRAATLDRWTAQVARPLNAGPRAVRVRLERAAGGAGSYIAVIQPLSETLRPPPLST